MSIVPERFHIDWKQKPLQHFCIFALSHFRTENRIPPVAREDGRKRPDASAGAGIFLKMLSTRRQPGGRRRSFAQITSGQRGVLAEHDAWQVDRDLAIFAARGYHGVHR
jgi:hypothetical protein